jgi:hypothetical protein
LLHVFSFIPEEKLNWSPSITSRTSAHIVAHCAAVFEFVEDALAGNLPKDIPSVEDFFKNLSEREGEILANEDVAVMVKGAVAKLSKTMLTVSAENIDSTADTCFGPLPLRFLITLAQEQLAEHTGQIKYLQTIWGDMDNHLG